jgi:hypothetical protein
LNSFKETVVADSRMALPADLPGVQRMAAYGTIAQSLQVVEQLRLARHSDTGIKQRTDLLRSWQSARFRHTYSDLLRDPHMGAAALFFLTELYSDQEFSRRDAQFARIAGTLERIFPDSVVKTATLLAQLHALSETLDACMARTWLSASPASLGLPFHEPCSQATYRSIWQALLLHPGFSQARHEQLEAAHALGLELQRHTRVPGLRLMLKMMRGPASAAGLLDLQRFLERGFDTFGQLGRAGKVEVFLQTIVQRERDWIAEMTA